MRKGPLALYVVSPQVDGAAAVSEQNTLSSVTLCISVYCMPVTGFKQKTRVVLWSVRLDFCDSMNE